MHPSMKRRRSWLERELHSLRHCDIPIDPRSFLEVVDLRNRYGKNLRTYYKAFIDTPPSSSSTSSSSSSTSSSGQVSSSPSAGPATSSAGDKYADFFLWLDSAPKPEVEGCPRSLLDSETVYYCPQAADAAQYRVEVCRETGLLTNAIDGSLLTTISNPPHQTKPPLLVPPVSPTHCLQHLNNIPEAVATLEKQQLNHKTHAGSVSRASSFSLLDQCQEEAGNLQPLSIPLPPPPTTTTAPPHILHSVGDISEKEDSTKSCSHSTDNEEEEEGRDEEEESESESECESEEEGVEEEEEEEHDGSGIKKKPEKWLTPALSAAVVTPTTPCTCHVNTGTCTTPPNQMGLSSGDDMKEQKESSPPSSSSPPLERWIFVMKHGSFFCHPKVTRSFPRFHHSSFFGGSSVDAAGIFSVRDGRVDELHLHSGHYRPTEIHLYRLLLTLLRLTTTTTPATDTGGEDTSSLFSSIRVDAQRVMRVARMTTPDGSKMKKLLTTSLWPACRMLDFLANKKEMWGSGVFRQIQQRRAVAGKGSSGSGAGHKKAPPSSKGDSSSSSGVGSRRGCESPVTDSCSGNSAPLLRRTVSGPDSPLTFAALFSDHSSYSN